MTFRDAPVGARFKFLGDDSDNSVYVKIHCHGDGLIVTWNGNVKGHFQNHLSWLDEGYDFDSEILVI